MTKHIKMLIVLLLILLQQLFSQIESQVRDDNPSLFKNQRIHHSVSKKLFKNQSHLLEFITNIPDDSVLTATLFMKTDFMAYHQKFLLSGNHGLYRFTYNPENHPGNRLQYYFILETSRQIYGIPVDSSGNLNPVDKLFIDPVEYFKQQKRLNK